MISHKDQRGFLVKDDYTVTKWSVLGHREFVEIILLWVRMEATLQNTLGEGMVVFPCNFINRH